MWRKTSNEKIVFLFESAYDRFFGFITWKHNCAFGNGDLFPKQIASFEVNGEVSKLKLMLPSK